MSPRNARPASWAIPDPKALDQTAPRRIAAAYLLLTAAKPIKNGHTEALYATKQRCYLYLVVPAGKLRVAEEDVVRGEEGRRYGLGHVKPKPLEGVHLPRMTAIQVDDGANKNVAMRRLQQVNVYVEIMRRCRYAPKVLMWSTINILMYD